MNTKEYLENLNELINQKLKLQLNYTEYTEEYRNSLKEEIELLKQKLKFLESEEVKLNILKMSLNDEELERLNEIQK